MRLVASQDAHFILRRLRETGVDVLPFTYIDRIAPGRIDLSHVHGGSLDPLADIRVVILSAGRIAENGLEAELQDRVPQLYVVGDALAPRTFGAATTRSRPSWPSRSRADAFR